MDLILLNGLPCWLSCKEPTCQYRKYGLSPWVGKIPWRRRWQPTLVLLPEKSYGQKGLAGYSPWDHKRATQSLQLNDTTILLNNLPTHLTELSRSSAETHRAQSLPWFDEKHTEAPEKGLPWASRWLARSQRKVVSQLAAQGSLWGWRCHRIQWTFKTYLGID